MDGILERSESARSRAGTGPGAEFASSFSPPLVAEAISCAGRPLVVVRDDLLPGGSKQRGLGPYLESLVASFPLSETPAFVYASPFAGFAQVALSLVCNRLGVPCAVFTTEDPGRPGRLHPLSERARANGAQVQVRPSFVDAQRAAFEHASSDSRRIEVPLGFDCDGFNAHYEASLTRCWDQLRSVEGFWPRRLWLPVGSATLLRAFRKILGPEFPIVGVDVGVLPPDDPRIQSATELATVYLRAPERFEEPASWPPERIPSNRHYDSKLWRFLAAEALEGDVWWNVAE